MALDVGIYSGSGLRDPLERDLVVTLEDGDLAFLFEALEDIRNKTSVEIVPWEDARLDGAQLTLLDDHLIERISVVSEKPESWDEYIGFQVKPKKKIYVRLIKQDMLKKLNSLRKLIEKALEKQRVLFFFGD